MHYLSNFLGMFIRPNRTLQRLKADGAKLRYAFISLLIHSAFAMGKQMIFHIQGVPAEPTPWLRIPVERTWLFSFYTNFPVDVVQAIIFAGAITLFSRLFQGQGTFEGQFALYSFAFVPVNVLLIVGTFVLSSLGYGDSPLWIGYFISVLAWDLVLIVLAVKVEQQLAFIPSLVTAMAGFGPAFLFAFTYIR